MTDDGKREREQVLVPGAHRVIRMLDADEGPYTGALVTRTGGVAVRADAKALSGWSGWRFAGAEHVAAPLDLIRRVDGQDVLLPWCPETVIAFLARRTVAGEALSAGEISTLVGSVLRGVDELDGGSGATGGWWLTDDGRPVFAIGDGDTARGGAAEIVSRLRGSAVDRALVRTLTTVQQGLEQDRVPRSVHEGWESELFELAAPRPLRREVFAAERARDLVPRGAPIERGSRSAEAGRWGVAGGTTARVLEGMRERLGTLSLGILSALPGRAQAAERDGGDRAALPGRSARAVRNERRERAERAAAPRRTPLLRLRAAGEADGSAGRPERPAGRVPGRRRLLVAGAAAAAVLGIGLLWPTGSGDEADASQTGKTPGSASPVGVDEEKGAPSGEGEPDAESGALAQEPAAEEAQAAEEDAGDEPDAGTSRGSEASEAVPPGAEADPVTATGTLLAAIRSCHKKQDAVCGQAVAEGAGGVVVALADVGEATAELVDEYGDVAVVRLGTAESGDAESGADVDGGGSEPEERMLVLIRRDENWLVRDVYGVADQPG